MMMIKMMKDCFCGMVDRRKAFTPYFQPGPLSEILTIANLRQAASRVWSCAESEFRLCWMKFCNSDNHYATAPLYYIITYIITLHIYLVRIKSTMTHECHSETYKMVNTSWLKSCQTTSEAPWNYSPVSSLFPKMKIFSTLAGNY